MDMETIAAAGLGVGVLAAAIYNGWQTHRAHRQARRAADNAHPVANGWGTQVTTDLRYLRDAIDRAHSRMDEAARRQNTADERLADVARFSRTAAEQSSAAAAGLSAHLADHARSDAERRGVGV